MVVVAFFHTASHKYDIQHTIPPDWIPIGQTDTKAVTYILQKLLNFVGCSSGDELVRTSWHSIFYLWKTNFRNGYVQNAQQVMDEVANITNSTHSSQYC